MRISVIIPALNERELIAACIRSVRAQPGEREIIVSDGGSGDGTVEVAASLAAVIRARRGRAVQMNAGARAASGEILLFLHADTTLHPGAFEGLRAAMSGPGVSGGSFTLRFDARSPLLRFYGWCTRFRFPLFHYGDQGIFVRRPLFERMGGFREIPLMEDLELLGRLRHYGRLVHVARPVTTSARRFLERGIFRQQLWNTALVSAYLLGVSPMFLARFYGSAGGCDRKPGESLSGPMPGRLRDKSISRGEGIPIDLEGFRGGSHV